MNVDEIVATLDDVYFRQFHERETITNLHLIVHDGDHIVDVGRSLGQYPSFLNRRFRNLSITCIEPDVIRFAELQKRCAKWTNEGETLLRRYMLPPVTETASLTFTRRPATSVAVSSTQILWQGFGSCTT